MRRGIARGLLLGAALALLAVLPVAHGDGTYPGSKPDVMEIRDLAILAADLRAPTDVAIGDDGTVYVLDGYAGQVVALGADGSRSTLAVEGEPVGLDFGEGRLWLPRTDRPALLVLDPIRGTFTERAIEGLTETTRLTDAVVDGGRVVVVANEDGLYAADLDDGPFTRLDADLDDGVAFLAAAADGRRLAVTDVRHDRVLALHTRKQQTDHVGKWGVWEGTFVHPTGLAVDRRGRFFVADGFTGVIQVFDADGAFLGALGEGEELLRMEHPMGLAVDGERLIAVDWQQGRVLQMTVDDRNRPITPQGMYDRKVPRLSYLRGESTPVTLLGPVCQTCHDGSIESSAQVWDDQRVQHPVDIVPRKPIPAPFTVDEDGRLYCGTCHIPHRMGDAVEAHGDQMEVFLKEPRARSELCTACHTDVVAEVRQVAGPVPEAEAGHLVGEVHRAVPHRGAAAIAADISAVECLDCHAAHGGVGEMLLSEHAAGSGGCTRCHVGVAAEQGANTHPVNRPLSDPAAVRALRAKEVFLAPGDTVACLTCHDVHRSDQASWLTAKMDANDRCVVCHAEQSTLQGGGHDLRRGQQGHVATACLACHTIHEATGPALGRTGGDLRDPTGCQSCHGSGGSARGHIDPAAGHPLFERNPAPGALPSTGPEGTLAMGTPGNSSCLTCHDPHAQSAGPVNPKMLREPGGDAGTCLACHEEMRPALGSDHDLRKTPSSLSRQRADEMAGGGFCLACHGMHEAGSWHGWDARTGGPAGESMATRSCMGCHEPGNPAAGTPVRVWEHPTDLLLTSAKVPWDNTGELPLYDQDGHPTDDKQIGQIACLTCHDPHVWSPKRGGQGGSGEGDTRTSFLRPDWQGFCSGCHGEEALSRYRYFHDAGFREELQQKSERRDWPLYREQNP